MVIILVESRLDCFVFILLLHSLAPAVWNFFGFCIEIFRRELAAVWYRNDNVGGDGGCNNIVLIIFIII